jgi:hypothetical protein
VIGFVSIPIPSVFPSFLFDLVQRNSADALKPIISNASHAYSCLDLHKLTDFDLFQDQPPLISIAADLNTLNCASFLAKHGVLFLLAPRANPLSCFRICHP